MTHRGKCHVFTGLQGSGRNAGIHACNTHTPLQRLRISLPLPSPGRCTFTRLTLMQPRHAGTQAHHLGAHEAVLLIRSTPSKWFVLTWILPSDRPILRSTLKGKKRVWHSRRYRSSLMHQPAIKPQPERTTQWQTQSQKHTSTQRSHSTDRHTHSAKPAIM